MTKVGAVMTEASSQHYVFVLMGVSGSGKSVVANQVSQKLQTAFLDGVFFYTHAPIYLKWQRESL